MDTRFSKSYYKIKEAADIIGVPQSTLRYWESEFSDLRPRRTQHNQRYYTPTDMELLQIIRFLLHEQGLKVDAAKEYLRRNRKNISKKLQVIENLHQVRADLDLLLKSLNIRGSKIGIAEI